ncbi:hypothetical protein [Streptomyces sp. NRRL S-1868]|uniref:hypothetical protein n=1 Tax=Streptomyces sp. NRRL S-1868 TaxID=1463892 RepID=UPI0004CC1176|nr:hypothetical protein [Streptomyces sp. NRRL S-1868]
MGLTISAAVLFGILSIALIRARYAGLGASLILFLFGFFTADTGAAGAITNACRAIADVLTNVAA